MTADTPFQPEDFAAIRGHPRFRAAVDAHARAETAAYRSLPPRLKWLMRDLAGQSLTVAALILEITPAGLTGRSLAESARTNRTCSRGRALSFLTRLLEWDYARLTAGPEHWTQRRITLTGDFKAIGAGQAMSPLSAIEAFEPRLEGAARRGRQPGRFQQFLLAAAMLLPTRPDLFAGPDMPIVLFLGRDGGKRILDDLLGRQPADRTRLLEAAGFSRKALGRDNDVSRTQVIRLIADGEAQGLLRAEGRTLQFAPVLSDDAERHYALIFELVRVAALAAGLDRDNL